MRYVIALAAIPVLVVSVSPGQRRSDAPTALSDRLAPTAVATEGIREQRQDDSTFRRRWAPVLDLPPMREREIIHEPLLFVSHETPLDMARAGHPVRPALSRKVALRGDLCARHGMRKVNYGRTWRCRR